MATFKKFNKDKRPKRNTQSLLFKRKRFCRFTVAGVEEIGLQAGRPVRAREPDAVMERGPDRGVPPCPVVGGLPCHEELAAAGGQARDSRRGEQHLTHGSSLPSRAVDPRRHFPQRTLAPFAAPRQAGAGQSGDRRRLSQKLATRSMVQNAAMPPIA